MSERTCVTCAATLPPREPRTPGRNRLYCDGCKPRSSYKPKPLRLRDCAQCGEPVPADRLWTNAKYCSEKCRHRRNYEQSGGAEAARLRSAAAYVKVDYPVRECTACGASFKPKTRNSKCCSRKCQSARGRDSATKSCERPDCSRPLRAKGLCSNHYKQEHGAHHSKGSRETKRQLDRKRTQRRRALLRDPDAEVIDRDEIGERDGWRCGLCGKRVNNNLVYPHPRSPSLDHIIPLSPASGPRGKHRKDNVQISHLSCNVAKSNRVGGEQLLLIG